MKVTYARIRTAILGIGISIALTACQSQSDDAIAQNYRTYMEIKELKSSFYTEPSTGKKYPLVQGSVSNLGDRTLIVVELTFRFKNSTQQLIHEEQAYPIFVSEFARVSAKDVLKPGAKTRFAFKAPKCPPGWQPGAVDVEVTKIVFAKNG